MIAGTELVAVDIDAKATEIERQVAEARAQAESIEVHDEASAALATELLRQIQRRRKAAEKEREEIVKPIKDHANRLHRRIKDAMAPFEEVDGIIRAEVQRYTDERERIRRQESERLERERQERERKIREERERQEAEARAKREQAEKEEREARRLAQEAKDKDDAEVAAKLAEEAAAKAAEAQTAESAIAALPEVNLPTAVVPAAAKPEGLSTPKRWVIKSVTKEALPMEYLVPDTAAIERDKRAGVKENGQPPVIPGVEFEQVSGLAVRG
jgi:hypothetical protein